MKQIVQHLGSGRTELADVPVPRAGAGQILVATSRSLISPGTERMLVDFGKANPLQKARQQPERLREVMAKVLTDGAGPAIEAVRRKLDEPLALGYCSVGHVMEVGEGVEEFVVGDRVACNGAHAEFVTVPPKLCAKVPDGVTDDDAAFTVVGAIALQGLRLVAPTIGETIVVMGLGLIGQMAVQLLRANGCTVIGVDPDADRVALARRFGAIPIDAADGDGVVRDAYQLTSGQGVDAVIVTASTKSNDPVSQAAGMCRKRGRIVLVGVAGLALNRADFYAKELTFQVSCSYGPGRYDPAYEQQGRDYPVGFVRWTEQRNFNAVLELMASDRLAVRPLISHRFPISEALKAYELLSGGRSSMGILLEYPARTDAGKIDPANRSVTLPRPPRDEMAGAPTVGFIGAGNYASGTLIPAMKEAGARLKFIASAGGLSATHIGRKYGFEKVTTDTALILSDPDTDVVVIATRHDSHARFVLDALEAGKHVFVEKPLCLTAQELLKVEMAYRQRADGGNAPLLMVGFNRRFAIQVEKMRLLLRDHAAPMAMVMTVNAGILPEDHWTRDPKIGGGRIIGEACHFIDLLRHLAGAPIEAFDRLSVKGLADESATLQLAFADGSTGTIHYFTNGHRAVSKERLEIYCGGRILQLDNFRSLKGHGWPGFKSMKLWRQDKGRRACVRSFVDALKTGAAAPIAADEIFEVSRVAIALAEA